MTLMATYEGGPSLTVESPMMFSRTSFQQSRYEREIREEQKGTDKQSHSD